MVQHQLTHNIRLAYSCFLNKSSHFSSSLVVGTHLGNPTLLIVSLVSEVLGTVVSVVATVLQLYCSSGSRSARFCYEMYMQKIRANCGNNAESVVFCNKLEQRLVMAECLSNDERDVSCNNIGTVVLMAASYITIGLCKLSQHLFIYSSNWAFSEVRRFSHLRVAFIKFRV